MDSLCLVSILYANACRVKLTEYLCTGPSIISQFGFSAEQTTLLSMAPGAAAVVGSILVLFIAEYTCRTVAGIFSLVLSVTGTAMMLGIPAENYTARYGGYILTLQCKNHPVPRRSVTAL